MLKKPGRVAIIVPGLLFGFIIWAAISGSDRYLTVTGDVGMRSTLFFWMVFLVSPVLLSACGAVSEIFRCRKNRTGWMPMISYTAGLLAVMVAGILITAESSMDQYLPFIEPGLIPRLGFVIGKVIITVPFLLIIGVIFALFSLAGGYCAYRVLKKARMREG